MENKIIPRVAVYFGTHNFYSMMVIAAKSLLYNTPMDKVYFLIENDVFPDPLPDKIECINVSGQTYFPHDGPNYTSIYSHMVLLRAALPKIFPQHDVILSIDADTLVKMDIGNLWNTDLTGKYFASVKEVHKQYDADYYNAGVMLMNLQKMRDDHIDDRAIELLNKQYFRWKEQDVLNILCKDNIAELPSDYNCAPNITHSPTTVRIRHFIGPDKLKRIQEDNHGKYYSDMSWDNILDYNTHKRM